MSITVLAFVWRKPGKSFADFKDYYETRHMPLALEIIGADMPKTHTRHYFGKDVDGMRQPPTVIFGTSEHFGCDVVSELIFESQEKLDAFNSKLTEPEISARLTEDQEQFVDQQKLSICIADETIVTSRPAT
ncbi:MAG: hypothetical protein Q9165_000813 [Trypethelium subeluteriae]